MNKRSVFGDHLWSGCSHQLVMPCLLVVHRKSLYRHDNAFYLCRNGVSQVPEPHSNTRPPTPYFKEKLALQLESYLILLVREQEATEMECLMPWFDHKSWNLMFPARLLMRSIRNNSGQHSFSDHQELFIEKSNTFSKIVHLAAVIFYFYWSQATIIDFIFCFLLIILEHFKQNLIVPVNYINFNIIFLW